MLTESHTAVFGCERCETLWETLSITANASHIKRTSYKTVIGNLFQHLRKQLVKHDGTAKVILKQVQDDKRRKPL